MKRYFDEVGTDALKDLFAGDHSIASCRLGLLEVVATIARKGQHLGVPTIRLEAQMDVARRDYSQFQQIALSPTVYDTAEHLCWIYRLRAADAIHLSPALTWANGQPDAVVFAASDDELLGAAKMSGLRTLDPRRHGAVL